MLHDAREMKIEEMYKTNMNMVVTIFYICVIYFPTLYFCVIYVPSFALISSIVFFFKKKKDLPFLFQKIDLKKWKNVEPKGSPNYYQTNQQNTNDCDVYVCNFINDFSSGFYFAKAIWKREDAETLSYPLV